MAKKKNSKGYASLKSKYKDQTILTLHQSHKAISQNVSEEALDLLVFLLNVPKRIRENEYYKGNKIFKSPIWHLKPHKEGKAKYIETRYISSDVYNDINKPHRRRKLHIRLEHVFPRNQVFDYLNLLSEKKRVTRLMILKLAKSINLCIVSAEEDELLESKSPKSFIKKPWHRYKKAGVKVYDLKKMKFLDLR